MEYWDIYDKNKQLTGRQMLRDDWNMQDGEYHLSVLGAVVRPDGKFLITRRKADKPWGAGMWEVSGGGLKAGEDSADGIVREIREETGLNVAGCPGGFLFDYHRENPEKGDNYFVDVYRFILDFDETDVRPQEEETDGFMLADAEQIRELGERGEFMHYDSIKEVFGL